MNVLMKCGHVATGIYPATKKPVCPICVGIKKGAEEVEIDLPDLTGRGAKCIYCGNTRTSSLDLPFFSYKPNGDTDSYYCGCRGWD